MNVTADHNCNNFVKLERSSIYSVVHKLGGILKLIWEVGGGGELQGLSEERKNAVKLWKCCPFIERIELDKIPAIFFYAFHWCSYMISVCHFACTEQGQSCENACS